MSDHNVNAWDDHVDAIEAGEHFAHIRRMATILERFREIRVAEKALGREEQKLKREICAALGVSVGDVVDTWRPCKQVKITKAVGDIAWGEVKGKDHWIAVVHCEVAPKTSKGFHPKTRFTMDIFDEKDCSFTPEWFGLTRIASATGNMPMNTENNPAHMAAMDYVAYELIRALAVIESKASCAPNDNAEKADAAFTSIMRAARTAAQNARDALANFPKDMFLASREAAKATGQLSAAARLRESIAGRGKA